MIYDFRPIKIFDIAKIAVPLLAFIVAILLFV